MSARSDPRFQLDEWDPPTKPRSLPSQPDDEAADSDDPTSNSDEPSSSRPSSKIVKPLSEAEIAKFNATQDRAGIIYISRIPPGMRPSKVRHLMSLHGEVGRLYLQQEDPRRAYLRKKHTSTKKAHFTEGWVEFTDKKIARVIADMLNAQPIGGKKGSRWRDDVWTMKYLPRFKWNMLTEHVAHQAATHTSRLRIELAQSKTEQKDYLRQVELAKQLDKRAERKRKRGEAEGGVDLDDRAPKASKPPMKERRMEEERAHTRKERVEKGDGGQLARVLGQIF